MPDERFVELATGTVFARDFRVVKPLNSGGMGAVYVAEQVSTGMRRALKLMHPQLVADSKLRQRFVQEARIGSRIESEHVVQVVGAGIDEGTGMPWLAMELLKGEDLASLVARAGSLSPRTVEMLLGEVCHAVGAAHRAKIVHRDLKPENIFLARTHRADAKFTVKVLDFGIAKLLSEAKTATAAIGSPMWMAPEQTEQDGQIGPQTDVWAIGLIAFNLLTGRRFWLAAEDERASIAALLREVVLAPMPRASERAQQYRCAVKLPPAFDEWFAKAVNREPRARFADATVANETLARCLKGFPDAAPRATERSAAGAAPPAQTIKQAPVRVPVARTIDEPMEPRSPAQPEARAVARGASTTGGSVSDRIRSSLPRSPWAFAVFSALATGIVGACAAIIFVQRDHKLPSPLVATTVPPALTSPAPSPVVTSPVPPATTSDWQPIATATPSAVGTPVPARSLTPAPVARPVSPSSEPVPPPVPTGSGTLKVICFPGCDQVIDNGSALGPSPIIRRNESLGSHRIKLVWSDASTVVSTIILADQTATVRMNHPDYTPAQP